MIISKVGPLNGVIELPGDKSISHRAAIFASIANGKTCISNYLLSEDCLATLKILKAMGVHMEFNKRDVLIVGKGLNSLLEPNAILDVGNSGTGIRLLTGLLAGQKFRSTITGDNSIKSRPMDRLILPLRKMNALVFPERDNIYCPIRIEQSNLSGIEYEMPVRSAQVKSAILLAGLFASGMTIIHESIKTRDHTERMMNYLEYDLEVSQHMMILGNKHRMIAKDIVVPGDVSSAMFIIVATLISSDSKVLIKNIGLNNSRTGAIDVLKRMGGKINIQNKRMSCNEEIGDIYVESGPLVATEIYGDIIPTLIDEIPILAVAACFSEGVTVISDAKELRIKESDRIKSIVAELRKLNCKVEEKDDGLIISGMNKLQGSLYLDSHNDHRIAMALAVAASTIEEDSKISNFECVNTSFPEFSSILNALANK